MEFTEGLACVYRRMAEALKPGAPLAFTYHHNKTEAYAAVGVAVLDAGPDVFGLPTVPGRDGRIDPYPRDGIIDCGHGVCVPRTRDGRRSGGVR